MQGNPLVKDFIYQPLPDPYEPNQGQPEGVPKPWINTIEFGRNDWEYHEPRDLLSYVGALNEADDMRLDQPFAMTVRKESTFNEVEVLRFFNEHVVRPVSVAFSKQPWLNFRAKVKPPRIPDAVALQKIIDGMVQLENRSDQVAMIYECKRPHTIKANQWRRQANIDIEGATIRLGKELVG